MQDRDYYRALAPTALLRRAAEEGINPEMAIALADQLAASHGYFMTKPHAPHMIGSFHFNHSKETTK